MAFAWINGRFVEEADASVSIRDTGLLHAAGVFTTMRAARGRVFMADRHLRRLRDSCEALFVPLQHADETLSAAAAELLKRNGLADSDSRLRVTVTGGAATQDPLHGVRLEPTTFITATALEPYPAEFYERGMTVILFDEQKLNPYDVQAGHKTLNYLSRFAALREANRRSAGEALWFNVHNYLQSGSICNIFLVKDGALVTPPAPQELCDPAVAGATPYPSSAVLPGVTRSVVFDLAREANMPVRLAAVNVNELLDADELFITNSAMGVMPVCRIERKAFGNDRPGPVTTALASRYRERLARA
jgi:branched-chain amino acid aminotransferase